MQEMQEIWVWSLGQEDPLEEDMATHSTVLARRIPWTEEPGGPQSTGSQSWTCLKKLSTLYKLSKTTPVKSLNHIPTTHISNKFYLFWSREKSFLIQCESLLTAHEAQGGTHPSQSARFWLKLPHSQVQGKPIFLGWDKICCPPKPALLFAQAVVDVSQTTGLFTSYIHPRASYTCNGFHHHLYADDSDIFLTNSHLYLEIQIPISN